MLDRSKHQALMDKLLKNSSTTIAIKTLRERVQRWLANQRNSSWVVEIMQEKDEDGTPILIKWAHSCGDYQSTEMAITISKDVVAMLFMQEILVALNFERVMGLHFEVTSRFHNQPGRLSSRPGFRAMILHSLWFKFVCPWWESSVLQKPEDDKFKNTFRCINTIGNPRMRKIKTEQVKTGILTGYKQIIKLAQFFYQLYFCL